ncbi:hypothetical protein Barb6_01866 [Bacteroidales bacterium Barb6]|nr:hypothetical protein Barb6XT_02477 [Bacteroidales bacterium Barb6XT]OAV69865.1 hypothetical protein Barb6_01866 [Bacteroidales bacterium Barb6]
MAKETFKDVLGKYFIDLSKLAFAALVLGGLIVIFQNDESVDGAFYMLLVGVVASVLFVYVAKLLIKK